MIWVLLFLAGAIASFTLTVRSNVQQAAATTAAAEARALAEAGIALALHDLMNAQSVPAWKRRFPADGRSYACSLREAQMVVSVADEGGKIDLNTAGESLLRAMLTGLGVEAPEAARLAAAVQDYRDADGTRLAGGAEIEEYRQAGRSTGPKNAPFDTTVELAQVLGFNSELAARARPFITVHSEQRGVDPAKASPELLRLLGVGGPLVDAPQDQPAVQTLQLRLPSDWISPSPQRAFSLTVQATGPRGAVHAVEAVVRQSPSRSQPFAVASWQQVDAREITSPIDIGAC